MRGFSLSTLPQIEFGRGKLASLVAHVQPFCRRIVLVTGRASFRKTHRWQHVIHDFESNGIEWREAIIESEPAPSQMDSLASDLRAFAPDTVLAIGGGSVLDAGKALAGLIPQSHSVMDYLEGVGPQLAYAANALPFIAVPTTAGTGSEATKNAVLSVNGAQGFKKSFRSERLIARLALIDPDLLDSVPSALIAANGMDALTQLIESYVSLKSNPFTDALAEQGIYLAVRALPKWYREGAHAAAAIDDMAYAALLSGICLAQTGLGSVHGLASPLGAFFPIPHGVVCGTLLAQATRVNIQSMQEREPQNPALVKYQRIAALMEPAASVERMLDTMEGWTESMNLPVLSAYGMGVDDLPRVVAASRGSSMKTNPIRLTDAELEGLLRTRL